MIALITHSHVQQRGGLKQGNPAVCDVFWRNPAVSGEVVQRRWLGKMHDIVCALTA